MKSRLVAYTLLWFALSAVAAFGQQNPLRGPEQPPPGAAEPDQPVRPQAPILRPRTAPPDGQQPGGQSARPAARRPADPAAAAAATAAALPAHAAGRGPGRSRAEPVGATQQGHQEVRLQVQALDLRPGVRQAERAHVRRRGHHPVRRAGQGIVQDRAGREERQDGADRGQPRRALDVRREVGLRIRARPKKQVEEHRLPPELQGKAIANSPLPFLFGAEAQKLKQRYFIRIVTPPDVQDQIWLEAYPRFQQDAANFHHAQFVITTRGMSPFALMLVDPNGQRAPHELSVLRHRGERSAGRFFTATRSRRSRRGAGSSSPNHARRAARASPTSAFRPAAIGRRHSSAAKSGPPPELDRDSSLAQNADRRRGMQGA